MPRALSGVSVAVAAVALTFVFWQPLWKGGGLIGGDTYTYYFPQKAFYAESLSRGELPLWNPWVSLGYPQHAESQTGATYPTNPVLYRLLDLNAAYNATHLLHYIAAYVFSWLLARRLGLRIVGAHLAALVFAYGWFPPRACLEWAIFGGTYFPMILWCCESYLQTAQRRWLLAMAAGLGLFLLAGHFNLAFLTLLTVAIYTPARLWWAHAKVAEPVARGRWRALVAIGGALTLGFAIAAVQLLPTVELKQNSQRDNSYLNQTYGSIPPWYLTQVLWPRMWYGPNVNPDLALWSINWGSPPVPPGNTNKIEAHLYFGVIPFYLLVFGSIVGLWLRGLPKRATVLWAVLGLGAVLFATGWPIYWLRNVPGFGFFAGPGRYGMITTLAVALGSGAMLDRLLERIRWRAIRWGVVLGVFWVTIVDFHNVSLWVTNVTMVPDPPVNHRHQSRFERAMSIEPDFSRVYAPGPNLPTIPGINCVPEYLGIGPRAYFDPELAFPRNAPAGAEGIRQQAEWLQRAGVTHLLTFEPVDADTWPVDRALSLFDPFLNAAWGRGMEPMSFYRLKDHRPRVFFEGRTDSSGVEVRRADPQVWEIDVDDPQGGRLVLLDLAFPGWEVTVDGQPAEAGTFEEMFRAVNVPAGKHTVAWRYSPASFFWGRWISMLALGALAAAAVWPKRTVH